MLTDDDEAVQMQQAAEREILGRLDRKEGIQVLILAALSPAPATLPGRNQPCHCGSGRKSNRRCGR